MHTILSTVQVQRSFDGSKYRFPNSDMYSNCCQLDSTLIREPGWYSGTKQLTYQHREMRFNPRQQCLCVGPNKISWWEVGEEWWPIVTAVAAALDYSAHTDYYWLLLPTYYCIDPTQAKKKCTGKRLPSEFFFYTQCQYLFNPCFLQYMATVAWLKLGKDHGYGEERL